MWLYKGTAIFRCIKSQPAKRNLLHDDVIIDQSELGIRVNPLKGIFKIFNEDVIIQGHSVISLYKKSAPLKGIFYMKMSLLTNQSSGSAWIPLTSQKPQNVMILILTSARHAIANIWKCFTKMHCINGETLLRKLRWRISHKRQRKSGQIWSFFFWKIAFSSKTLKWWVSNIHEFLYRYTLIWKVDRKSVILGDKIVMYFYRLYTLMNTHVGWHCCKLSFCNWKI